MDHGPLALFQVSRKRTGGGEYILRYKSIETFGHRRQGTCHEGGIGRGACGLLFNDCCSVITRISHDGDILRVDCLNIEYTGESECILVWLDLKKLTLNSRIFQQCLTFPRSNEVCFLLSSVPFFVYSFAPSKINPKLFHIWTQKKRRFYKFDLQEKAKYQSRFDENEICLHCYEPITQLKDGGEVYFECGRRL